MVARTVGVLALVMVMVVVGLVVVDALIVRDDIRPSPTSMLVLAVGGVVWLFGAYIKRRYPEQFLRATPLFARTAVVIGILVVFLIILSIPNPVGL